jgi:protein phosphatase
VRARNEDNLLVVDLDRGRRIVGEGWSGPVSGGPRGTLVAVCDGCGGESAGDVASRMVAHDMVERAQNFPAGAGPLDVEQAAQLLVTALDRTNQHVLLEQKRDESLKGMGSTFTGFLLHRDGAICCHAGDSRAYLCRGGEFVRMTRDHTKAADLVESGELTPAAAERDPRRNELTQSVGRANLHPDVFWGRFVKGDRLLLCSDGLSGYVDEREIARALASILDPEEAAQALIEAALSVGAPDNVSLVVVSFGDLWEPRASRTAPAWPRVSRAPLAAATAPARPPPEAPRPPPEPPPPPPKKPEDAAPARKVVLPPPAPVPEYVPWEPTGVRAVEDAPPPAPRRSRSSDLLAALAALLGCAGACLTLLAKILPIDRLGTGAAVGATVVTVAALLYLLLRGAPRGGE